MIMITGTFMMTMNAWSISAVSHTMPAESSAPTNTSAVAYQAEDEHKRLGRGALEDELQAALGVIIVADERCERKQAHCHGNEYRAEIAKRKLHGLLNICSSGSVGNKSLGVCAHAHHCGRGTHEQRVDKNGQHLDKPLLYGVRYVRRRGGVGRRTHTGFVGVKAALVPHIMQEPAKPPKIALKSKAATNMFLRTSRRIS